MKKLILDLNTHNLIIYHLLQRFVYQYHSLFSKNKAHPSMSDLTQLWFLKLFYDNPYFKNAPNSVLVNYEIKADKSLVIVVRAPLEYITIMVSLEKDIHSCVTYINNEQSVDDVNIFDIDYTYSS